MRGRGPVVHLDRSEKARSIAAVIADFRGAPVRGLRTLDIGCGNGGISNHFAAENTHTGVDVVDQRKPVEHDFAFELVADETLPFPEASFDVVISNHVIEHVGDQLRHLEEIGRVLAPGGCVYLATPNRSSPIMEGHVGNESVLRHHEMEPLFIRAGFVPTLYSTRVAKEPERFRGEVRWARHIPRVLLSRLIRFFPSQIYILSR
ncbi:MAG: class I SAM-dependent methyltransferase [Pseudomonadota bacterium]